MVVFEQFCLISYHLLYNIYIYCIILCNVYGIENIWPEETFPIVMWYNARYYALQKRDSLFAVSSRYRRWSIVTTKHSRLWIVVACSAILNKHAIITKVLLISLLSHKMSLLPLLCIKNNPNLTTDFWFGAPKQRTPNKKCCEVWDLSRTEASLVRGVSLINN